MTFSTGEEEVRGVWRGWIRLAARAPSPVAIRREREAWIVRHVANKPGSRIMTAEAAAESLAVTTLARFKSFMTSDGADGFKVANWSFYLHASNWHARQRNPLSCGEVLLRMLASIAEPGSSKHCGLRACDKPSRQQSS